MIQFYQINSPINFFSIDSFENQGYILFPDLSINVTSTFKKSTFVADSPFTKKSAHFGPYHTENTPQSRPQESWEPRGTLPKILALQGIKQDYVGLPQSAEEIKKIVKAPKINYFSQNFL